MNDLAGFGALTERPMNEGCLEWQEHGLEEPKTVTDATNQYREEMDTLASFLDEVCVVGAHYRVLAERLYQRYAMWCDNSGERKDPKKAFVARLEERGFERRWETAGVNKGKTKTLLPPKQPPRVEKDSDSGFTGFTGFTPDQVRRIRKLIQQGMSEALAREEVLGKGWVEP